MSFTQETWYGMVGESAHQMQFTKFLNVAFIQSRCSFSGDLLMKIADNSLCALTNFHPYWMRLNMSSATFPHLAIVRTYDMTVIWNIHERKHSFGRDYFAFTTNFFPPNSSCPHQWCMIHSARLSEMFVTTMHFAYTRRQTHIHTQSRWIEKNILSLGLVAFRRVLLCQFCGLSLSPQREKVWSNSYEIKKIYHIQTKWNPISDTK